MSRRTRIGAVALAGAVVAVAVGLSSMVQATHSPANKTWVSASTVEWMTTQIGPGLNTSTPEVLAQSRAKYNNPTDLRISVTSECALWTNTATTGDDDSEAKARVELWVTIDGKTVPVSIGDTADPNSSVDPDDKAGQGRVVFCNRAARMKTENIETLPRDPDCVDNPATPLVDECVVADPDNEDDILIRSYNRTRDANGFNWGALDIGRTYDDVVVQNGKGTLEIKLFARLAAQVIDPNDGDEANEGAANSPAALAGVGKRTLFVEPVKMANDAEF